MFGGKKRKFNTSPAVCILPQIREGRRGGRSSRRDVYDNDSPGKLFTYVSAGHIEIPGDDYRNKRRFAHKNPICVYIIALILLTIWIVFGFIT